MFWSLLFYPTLWAQATENDGAVIIKLGGEVVSADSNTQSLPAKPISLDVVHMDITEVIRIFSTHSGQISCFQMASKEPSRQELQTFLGLLHYNRSYKATVGRHNNWRILLIEPLNTATK